jgi:SulP family sulfate permease
MFNKQQFTDTLAGITLAIVVLPQAIAFSTALAGVPPEYGIYSAIIGTLIIALLNPSSSFLGGPNSTMSAVIGTTLIPLAPQFSNTYIGYMLSLIFIAGLIQIAIYAVKPVGRLFDLIPESVTNGIIAGIGFFLIYKSLPSFAGLPVNTQVYWLLMISWQTLLSVFEIGNMNAITIGLITFAVGITAYHIPVLRVWYIMIGLVTGTLYSQYIIHLHGNENLLIEQVGNISIPFISPSLPTFDRTSMPDIISMIPGAITLAFIGIFQTVTAMRYLDRKQGKYNNVRDGIKADAVANCILPFTSSLPTCGSYNRMSMLQNVGSKSKISVFISVLVLFGFSYLFADLLSIIPIPALAAIIMLVGFNMISWKDIRLHFFSKVEAVTFITSFMAIHIFGLFGAVIAGSLISLAHFVWLKSHPRIVFENDVVYVNDTIYYGSLPELEKIINQIIIDPKYKHLTEQNNIVIDISNVHYVCPEAVRFLLAFELVGGVVQPREKLTGTSFKI